MRKKLLRSYKIIVSTICAMVFSFAPILSIPNIVKAEELGYITKWSVTEELLNSIKNLNGGIPKDAMFMYESLYYDIKGINSTVYNANGYSSIYGNSDNNGQKWKTKIDIETDHFYIQSASLHAKGIAFKVPAPGVYEIIPEGIGTLYPDYSVFANKGNWSFEILNGTEVVYQATINENTGVLFNKIELTLKKDDVIRFNYYAPGYIDKGYTIYSNFSIGLVEEFESPVLVNPQYEEKVYNASEYLTTLTSTKLSEDYSIAPFSAVCGSYNTPVTEWVTAPAKFNNTYYWFTHTQVKSWGDTGYFIRAYSDSNNVFFGSKHRDYLTALAFTAPNDGVYTFYGDNIKQNGKAGWNFSLVDENNDKLVTVSPKNAGGKLDYTIELKAGQKIYYYFEVSSTDYSSGCIELYNFKVVSTELVYNEGFEDGFVFTKTMEEYLEDAEIKASEYGDLAISFTGSKAFDYSVFYYDNGAFKSVEKLDDGSFFLFNTYKDFVDFCFMATDVSGKTAIHYLTYVYKTNTIYNFKINGNSVFDKALVDIESGTFDLQVTGKNISVKYDGQAVSLTYNKSKITENKNGVHLLELTFGDFVRTVEVNTFNAEDSYNRLIGHITTENNEVNFFALKHDSSIYSYMVNDFSGETIYSTTKTSNKDKTVIDKYGIYNASIGIKNDESALNNATYNQQIQIKRPGGEWTLKTQVADSFDKTVYASVGYPIEIVASSTFAGYSIVDVDYAFYLKDNDELIKIKDYSLDNFASFTPDGSGVYDLFVAVKGKGAGSAEAIENVKIIVADDSYSGSVSVKGYSFNGAGETARIEAEATSNNSDEIFFRFYAVYSDDVVLIKDYSLDNFAEFIPTRPEYFNVRVEVKNQNNRSGYDAFCVYDYEHICDESEVYSLAEFSCDDTVGVTICSICGKKINVSNIVGGSHDFGDWEIVEHPTITETGVRKRNCINHPEHVETEIIERIEIEEIEIVSLPNKLTYNDREIFDPTGLIIKVTYDNGEKTEYFNSFDREQFKAYFYKNGTNEVVLDFFGNEVKFDVTVNKLILIGDADNDGTIDSDDVQLIAKYISGYNVSVHSNADINNDGIVDIADLVLLKQYMEGYKL